MLIIRTTVLKTGALRKAPAGKPIATTVPRERTYSAACWKGFSATARRMTACAPRPSGVAALTSATRSWVLVKSTYAYETMLASVFILSMRGDTGEGILYQPTSAPSCSHMACFSSPPSIATTRIPIAFAYCSAKEPRPPPAPTMATVWPGRTPDSFRPL